jgi:MFS family permease
VISAQQSRRNVRVAAATSFMGFAGFTVVMPFIPLYISQLGVSDVGEVAMWSGLTLGATPAITAISAPLWGRVGDRYGSKVLVLRSLAAFVLTKGAMAFVTAPWQLVALRGLLGVFAGYGALTMAMAAESVSRDEMPRAIGVVQMGQRLGPAIGPIVGGVLAPVVGLRQAFLVTAGFYLVAMVMVAVVYREPRTRVARTASRSLVSVARELVATPGFLLALAVIFTLQTVDRSFSPILPLFVEQLGIGGARVATVSGVLFSMIAVCAAIGHKAAGGLMRAVVVTGVDYHGGVDHGPGPGRDRRPAVDVDADRRTHRRQPGDWRRDDRGLQRGGRAAAGRRPCDRVRHHDHRVADRPGVQSGAGGVCRGLGSAHRVHRRRGAAAGVGARARGGAIAQGASGASGA